MHTDPVFAALRYAHSEEYEHPGICGGSGGALHVPTAIPWPGREAGEAASCTAEGSHTVITECTDCGEELSRESVTDKALGEKTGDGPFVSVPLFHGNRGTETKGPSPKHPLNISLRCSGQQRSS